jgi:hypothetical protein
MTASIRVFFSGGPKHGDTEVISKDPDQGLWYDGPRTFAYYRATSEAADTPHGPAQVMRYEGERLPQGASGDRTIRA